ncbi:MAG: VCBS repeat-containing protein [Saprospiraceae bacterium]|nr:VCBS repeat-containing protein [Saprospiraceae bacterium]
MNKNTLNYLALFFCFFCFHCKENNQKTDALLFELIDPQKSGIKFVNKLLEYSDEHIFNFNYLYNGAGVAIGDINKDGLQDIYFTANRAKDKLYLNKGNFKFEDISESSGIAAFSGWRSGVSMADVNADGFLDIYICRGGFKYDSTKNANLLFINNGNQTFTESAAKYGIADIGFSIAACFFDYDNDNDLDLYVTNRPEQFYLNVEQVMEGKKVNNPLYSDHLYRNNGDHTFTNVTQEAGITHNFGYGLSVSTGDLDQDGDQDIYVSNDFVENDYYYENQGNGTFREVIKEVTGHVPYYAMGTDIGDINNDGWEDIFTVEMRPEDYKRSKTSMPVMSTSLFDTMDLAGIHRQFMHNCLQLNHGNGHFSDIAQLAGVDRTDWSWAALICDFDNDGFRDLYVANGIKRDLYNRDAYAGLMHDLKHNNMNKTTEEIMRNLPSFKAVNYAFRNNGDLTFTKAMKEWGLNHTSQSHGAALGDLDNDGNLDLVVNNMDDIAFVFKNNGNGKKSLRVQCNGPEKNPKGIGARVEIQYGDQKQYSEMRTSRGYLSSCEPFIHFGIGEIEKVDVIKIIWPDGKSQELKNQNVDKPIVLNYSDAGQQNISKKEQIELYFSEMNGQIIPEFRHLENDFDDYKKQILLPHRLSRMGPKISVADINADGLEDFFVGGARNQSGALYVQLSDGSFKRIIQKALDADKLYEDLGSVFFDADLDKDQDLYVVSGGSENEEGKGYQDRLYLNDGKGNFTKSNSLPKISSSGSQVAVYDFDADGDLDLFRTGRLIPDQYPFAPRSYLLENKGKGNFVDVTEKMASELLNPGMICDAIWADIDGDQKAELIIAGEWMTIQIFKFESGKFKKLNAESVGLQDSEGWWNSIQAADLDDDGDLDLVAGNLGLNYKFHASVEKPFQIYCNDFDKNGTYDIVLAKYNGDIKVPVRGKQCSQEQMPFINKKFPSYNDFADANLEQIYGEGLNSGLKLESKEFQTCIFINEAGKFKKQYLPIQSQFSTTQSIIIEDFNKDGKKDILLAGNNFHSEVETTKADAGVGNLLIQKAGSFSFTTVLESGLYLPYDVKDIQLINTPKGQRILVGSNNEVLRILKVK